MTGYFLKPMQYEALNTKIDALEAEMLNEPDRARRMEDSIGN